MPVKNQKKVPSKPPAAQPSTPQPFRKSTVREYFESIVIAVILALFIRTFVVQAFKIPTGSMENNLLIGDHLLVNKFVVGPTTSSIERALLPVRPIRRGDVIVFKYPEDRQRDFIKRVIDGKPLEEPYVHFLEPPAGPSELHEVTSYDVRENYGPVSVPANEYFMMGDNRDNSQDSRYWQFLPRDYIKGRAMMVYWSYRADRVDYQDTDLVGGIRGIVSTFAHFFTRTRWDRLFHQIH